MKVKLLRTLAVPEARRLELEKFDEGDSVDVDDEVAKEMVTKGYAILESEPAAQAAQAAPPPPPSRRTPPVPPSS